MNSHKALQFLSKRAFSSSIYNYTASSNPKVYFTVSKNGRNLGDLVFELYQNHVPRTTEHILSYVTGSNTSGASYAGTKIEQGKPGFVLQGGNITDVEIDTRFVDENLNLRHYKRGQLSLVNEGENSNGSAFYITLDQAELLDKYNVVLGELVEGESVLSEIEKGLNRHGQVEGNVKIESSGTR